MRDKSEQTPAGMDSNSLHRLSGHSDTPLSHTATEMPRERPDERSGEKHWTSAAFYTRTGSTKTHAGINNYNWIQNLGSVAKCGVPLRMK